MSAMTTMKIALSVVPTRSAPSPPPGTSHTASATRTTIAMLRAVSRDMPGKG